MSVACGTGASGEESAGIDATVRRVVARCNRSMTRIGRSFTCAICFPSDKHVACMRAVAFEKAPRPSFGAPAYDWDGFLIDGVPYMVHIAIVYSRSFICQRRCDKLKLAKL